MGTNYIQLRKEGPNKSKTGADEWSGCSCETTDWWRWMWQAAFKATVWEMAAETNEYTRIKQIPTQVRTETQEA